MINAQHVKSLRNYLKKLKKQKITPGILRTIIRLKALIAFYQGHSVQQAAGCYDISVKSLKRRIKLFESCGCEILCDAERSGRP